MTSPTTILIIEDDEELRSIYRQALERENYIVHEATDGADALQRIENIKPDLIILDMMMPRMGGPTVLQILRQNPAFNHVHFVVITAYPQFRESALSYNVDQFLTKPVRPGDIVQAVQTALESG
jgi:CheY-like chemotaxis protein